MYCFKIDIIQDMLTDRLRAVAVGVGSWEATKQVVNQVAGMYVPALQVALWSVDLDAPLLWAGAHFLATAAGIYRAVGVQEAELHGVGGEKPKTS